MIETPTVFVLGAGASIPYGFPSAWGLVEAVVAASRREAEATALRDLGIYDRVRIDAFRDSLSRAAFNSVDYFLECRPEYLDLGRAFIAMCIARLEDDSHYFSRPGGAPGGPPGDDPYRHLLNSMWGPRDGTISRGRAAFVTFNYDRSLEQYLANAVQARCACSYENAIAEVERIPIVHVYGSLGSLKRDVGPQTRFRPFGTTGWNDAGRNTLSMSLLRLIGDDRGHPADAAALDASASELIREASRVVFLGFGYDEANLQRIKPANRTTPLEIFGTTLGLAAAEAASVHINLASWGEHDSQRGLPEPCSNLNLCTHHDRRSERYLREAIRL